MIVSSPGMTQGNCYLHPKRAAEMVCKRCNHPICNRCTHNDGIQVVCVACVGGLGVGKILKSAALVLGLVGVLGGVAFMLYGLTSAEDLPIAEQSLQELQRIQPKTVPILMRMGELYAESEATQTALKTYKHVLKLDTGHIEARIRLGVIHFSHGHDVLAKTMLTEARAAGSTDPIIDQILKQITDQRRFAQQDDKAKSQARAQAKYRNKKIDADQRQAATEERRTAAEERLAAAEERHTAAVEQRTAAVERRAAVKVEAEEDKAAAWEEARERERNSAAEDCYVDLSGKRSLLLNVEINGEPAKLIYDTGATSTIITRELADRLDLPIDPDRVIRAQTANGRTKMQVSVIDITIEGVTQDDIFVGICNNCPTTSDGLFGVREQRAFDMELDLKNRRVRVPGCQ